MPNYTKVGHSKLDFLFFCMKRASFLRTTALIITGLIITDKMCILYVELYDQVGHFNVCKPMTKCGTPYTIHESIS